MKRLIILASLVATLIAAQADAETKKVIIRYRDAAAMQESVAGQQVQGKIYRKHTIIPAIAAEVPEGTLDQLRRNSAVAYVEDNVAMSLPADVEQAGSPEEYAAAWGVERIGARVAAATGISGEGVKIAIIDSGIDYNHPELKDVYVEGDNFIYPGNHDPYDDTTTSHGTHVAGIIAAAANATGVVGVAPKVSLYALKVLDATGWGDASVVVKAIEWAIEKKVDIINISSGTYRPSQLLQEACDKAYAAGIVIVAAAGNGGQVIGTYPALYDSVIAVSATKADDTLGSFSNYGPKIELAAPGDAITSTAAGGGYRKLRGTSQAAPHVTGAAALLLSTGYIPKGLPTTPVTIRKILNALAIDMGTAGRDEKYGFGLVDVSKIGKIKLLPIHCDETDKETVATINLPSGDYSFSVFNDGMKKLSLSAAQPTISRMVMPKAKVKLDAGDVSVGSLQLPVDATVSVTSKCHSQRDALLVITPSF